MKNEFAVFDGHNDTILDLFAQTRGGGRSFFEQSDKGHIDLPRAKAGGFGGGFFAIFITPPAGVSVLKEAPPEPPFKRPLPAPLDHKYALKTAMQMVNLMWQIEKEADGQAKIVETADQLQECLDDGTLAMIFHFEGAEMIDPDLHALHVFHQVGLRSIGPVWSRPTAFANGVPFNFPDAPDIGEGLTEAGVRLVKTCNELGIMLDLSHLNEKGFWDVARLSDAPLVATHSNAHVLCQSPRNLTNKQLEAVAASGGVVGINFHKGFLRADGRFQAETSLTEIVRHANYIADHIGIDHVALGSDFDGANMPDDLPDVAALPSLVDSLRQSGHDDASLKKILHENWVRVLRQTWKE
ncbi:MAG: dipeptidase [Chloroflexota bacterium]